MPDSADRTTAVRGLLAVVVATAVNATLVPVARALELAPEFGPLSYPPVVFLTAFTTLAATVVYAAVTRLSTAPARTFRRLAVAVLAVSLAPLALLVRVEPAATVPGVTVLFVMHLVVVFTAVGSLTRGPRDADGTDDS